MEGDVGRARMSQTLTVREARPDEWDAVAHLLLECFREHLPAFPSDVSEAYVHEVGDISTRASSSRLLVADLDSDVVGSVTFVPDAIHDGHPWPPGGSVIRLLAVHPQARRRGVARALSLYCIDLARRHGAAFVALHTAPFMTSARSLYQSLNFKRAPSHDFNPNSYYGSQQDSSEQGDQGLWGLAYVLPLSGAKLASAR